MAEGTVIREVKSEHDLSEAARVIRDSFRTAADEFGFTEQNWPTHPAFITEERVRVLVAEGLRLYALFLDKGQVGVVGIRRLDDQAYSLEKLGVLPEHRHQGYGKKLVDFVCEAVKNESGRTVHIRVVEEDTLLKQWYCDLGFV
ncbi:MAG: GNAT family N-acetyltransferase, partial [Armatimonadetes bacterium]|nr:GNAT family N-acetyltransferase [Armatimonadota bacterium]NIM24790.1 GNAT family N-acetyltransferase [Armatimonadota bacterium]NIM68681.1 GNAT family N-acetyltransferase [Armatimonadota bacterium]NIM76976.1 GNAT family N-acetyltransferase [Armatimonadota bacterium]NIN06882.1 GNAT family N-acetyltransferase [Armatimonadota bacterium]